MRRPIVAANWNMHKTVAEAEAFARDLRGLVDADAEAEAVVAPPFTALATLGRALEGSGIGLAAQNVHPEEKGAYTGEVAPGMLAELGCRYAIVGHSERRGLFDESDAFVAAKAEALLRHGIRPIVCVGESLEEREAERTFAVVGRQIQESLARVPKERAEEVVIAYEPVWAIGTGRTATPDLAQEVHAMIRERLRDQLGADAADAIRIQYGGSVKPDNAAELMAQPDVDGARVGGASLEAESFAAIVHFRGSAS
ncbi:MAG: triose-phosphate isomerase [Myxococcota bacterium]|nr:triose-phosphate isomerase [Myxococcota bacterium]